MFVRNSHKALSQILHLICIAVLLMPTLALAQQGPTQKLREVIMAMEKIDQDPNTSDEVRAINRALLAERRTQLFARLLKELDSLKEYSQTMAGSLSHTETQKISNRVDALKSELNVLKQSTTSAPNRAAQTRPASTMSNLPATPSTNFEAPSDAANRAASNHPRSAVTSSALQVPACFPDAPNELINIARAAAELYVTGDDASSQFGDLMFVAVAHTVAMDANREDLLKAIEVKQLQEQTRRTDKQIGAPASAAGSTTLAEKPGFAEILGLAIEHGAIQQAVSGTTLNLGTTPYAFTTLSGGDTQSNYKKYGYLTRLGISANFNILNQDTPLASVRRSQLADWSVRLRLSKDRSTRSDDAEAIWNSIRGEFARPSIVITSMLRDTFQGDVELEHQRRGIVDRLVGSTQQPSITAIRDSTTLSEDQKIDQVAEKLICQAKAEIVDAIRAGSFDITMTARTGSYESRCLHMPRQGPQKPPRLSSSTNGSRH